LAVGWVRGRATGALRSRCGQVPAEVADCAHTISGKELAMRPCKPFAACALAVLAAAAAAQGVPQDAKKARDRLTGDAAGTAANNPQCKLFTPAEAGKYIGEPVAAGQNAAMGSGCQWTAKGDGGDVLVQVVPANYFTPPKLAKGYKELTGIGSKAYVVPEMGGWVAGALVGSDGVLVSVAGKAASETQAVALLQETLKRRKP
jgi:hypothetical protein